MLFYLQLLFFFNDTATTEIYTLSLHDALPISSPGRPRASSAGSSWFPGRSIRVRMERPFRSTASPRSRGRSEEHTSELQSQSNLVCRLLLEKKKKRHKQDTRQERTKSTELSCG